ncbi:MAG: DUF1801 domain-containing protein [Myxococcales bacterium]|nr:DUF1801 domain-containing protein [Myxococcales bacterium]
MSTGGIRTTGGNGDFEAVIAEASPAIQALARAARDLIADVMPGVTEVPWAKQRTVGYGVGAKKMSEHFCYLAPATKHLGLGFFYGADLDDPAGLLEGSGKLLRHVKLREPADLERPALRELLVAASRHLPRLNRG